MANEYKIAYPRAAAAVIGRLYRGSSLIETIDPLDEDAGDYLSVYSKASSETWQAGDDILYYDDTDTDDDVGEVIDSETYKPEVTPVGGSSGSSGLLIPAGYVGDYIVNDSVYLFWWTMAEPSANGTIKVYKDGDTGEITAPTGILQDVRNFDGQNWLHMIQIDTSVNTFYAKERDFCVMVEGIVIDGVTLDAAIGSFSVENRYAGKQFIRDG